MTIARLRCGSSYTLRALVALEDAAQIGAAGGDDGQIVRRGDFVEALDGDLLDDDAAAAGFEFVHPARRLQADVDRLERRAESSDAVGSADCAASDRR